MLPTGIGRCKVLFTFEFANNPLGAIPPEIQVPQRLPLARPLPSPPPAAELQEAQRP